MLSRKLLPIIPLSKARKQLDRLLAIPADFTWDELVSILKSLGFELIKSSGSYRCFTSTKGKIFLHEPHPSNVVKRYALRDVRDKLIEYGFIRGETGGD